MPKIGQLMPVNREVISLKVISWTPPAKHITRLGAVKPNQSTQLPNRLIEPDLKALEGFYRALERFNKALERCYKALEGFYRALERPYGALERCSKALARFFIPFAKQNNPQMNRCAVL